MTLRLREILSFGVCTCILYLGTRKNSSELLYICAFIENYKNFDFEFLLTLSKSASSYICSPLLGLGKLLTLGSALEKGKGGKRKRDRQTKSWVFVNY